MGTSIIVTILILSLDTHTHLLHPSSLRFFPPFRGRGLRTRLGVDWLKTSSTSKPYLDCRIWLQLLSLSVEPVHSLLGLQDSVATVCWTCPFSPRTRECCCHCLLDLSILSLDCSFASLLDLSIPSLDCRMLLLLLPSVELVHSLLWLQNAVVTACWSVRGCHVRV